MTELIRDPIFFLWSAVLTGLTVANAVAVLIMFSRCR